MRAEPLTRWTEEEIQFIKDNFKTMPQKEIAEKLGRSYPAVTNKVKKLRLIKQPKLGKTDKLLKKGDQLSYSEIVWLREQGVSIDKICKATKMDKSEYNEFMKNHDVIFR